VMKEDVIVFFEILDFASPKELGSIQTSNGWHQECWAFLKLVGKTQEANTEEAVFSYLLVISCRLDFNCINTPKET
jgi:hypothetical protein